MKQSRIVESLYNKYGLNESLNTNQKSLRMNESRNRRNRKPLREDALEDAVSEFGEQIKFDEFIKIAENHSFKVIDLDNTVLHVLKEFTPNYSGGVYVELSNDGSFKTIEADVYFNGEDDLSNTKYFDDFEKAIDWCEQTIPLLAKNANEIITIDYIWDDIEGIEEATGEIEDIKKAYNINTVNINEISDWGDEFEVTLEGKKQDLLTYLMSDGRLDIDEILAEYPEFQNALSITESSYNKYNVNKRKPLREDRRNRKLNESSYSEPLFERIEEALYEAGLNVTRFNEAGLMTNNLGWVVSDDDGNEVQMECLGTW